VFLATHKQLRPNRNGQLYLQVELADRSGAITGRMWNASDVEFEAFDDGDYVRVEGMTQLYSGNLQLIIQGIGRVDPRTVDESEYQVLSGAPGYSEQIAAINNHFPLGEIIFFLHDDIKRIKYLNPLTSLKTNLIHLIDLMNLNRVGLAGWLPNSDKRCMTEKYTTKLTHVVGSCFLCVNRNFVGDLLEVEDYHRSVEYFLRDGKILRYKGGGVDTKYNSGSGGLTAEDRMIRKKRDCDALATRYPLAADSIIKRDMPDIKLNWRFRVGG
jgi:hypothetical protein